MKVYYKSTLDLIKEAIDEAARKDRTIDFIELAPEEWVCLKHDTRLKGCVFGEDTTIYGIKIEITK